MDRTPASTEQHKNEISSNSQEKPKRLIKRLRGRARKAFDSAFHKLFPIEHEEESRISVPSILSLVATMGQLSFRAYNDPKVLGFEEYTTSATRIRHVNWSVLNESLEGVLKIHLDRARNVLDADFGPGTSDPYVVFSTGWSQVASEYKTDDENPVWNSTHYLLIRKESVVKRDNSKLLIRLFDSDWATGRTEEREHRQFLIRDDFLGSTTLDMAELKEPGIKRREVKLHLDGDNRQQKTTVLFNTEFISFEEACEELGRPEESDSWVEKIEESEHECKWAGLPLDVDIGQVTFQPVAFINAVKTGTQVWIHVNAEAKAVAVAFRGTEATRFKDVMTDLSIIPSKFKLRKEHECELELTPTAKQKKIRVHSGFKAAYHSIWSSVMEIVEGISDWSEDWTICITGHSLGGAVATLCAFEFANRMNEVGKVPRVLMMNFGAPRSGNRKFIHLYKETVRESYRVVNGMDIIHKIPFFLKHVDVEVEFEENGELYVDKKYISNLERTDSVLEGEGLGKSEKPQKKLTKKAFFKTPGFKGHFENYYFDVVTRAIASLFESDKERFHHLLDGIKSDQLEQTI